MITIEESELKAIEIKNQAIGKAQAICLMIKKVMENSSCDINTAMAFLGIPVSERNAYSSYLSDVQNEMNSSDYWHHKYSFLSNSIWSDLINKVKELHKFLDHVVMYQIMGRVLVSVTGEKDTFSEVMSISTIVSSCTKTLWGVMSCLENGCIADSYMLIRKYRDDLYFALLCIIQDKKLSGSDSLKSQVSINKYLRKYIEWLDNRLTKYNVRKEFIKELKSEPNGVIFDFEQRFNISERCGKYSEFLNNYTHSNGIVYMNLPDISYLSDEIIPHVVSKQFYDILIFHTLLFLSVLFLLEPLTAACSDYKDILECGGTPDEAMLHWVDPAIQVFLKANYSYIGTDLIDFLREKTGMEF